MVSSEELKHEMSAEKGLAWFDLGDGRIVKGRSLWFHSDLPDMWEGREFLTQYERLDNDEIGLAEWVDEQILNQEQKETSARFAPSKGAVKQEEQGERASPSSPEHEAPSGPFRLGSGPRGVVRGRGSVVSLQKEEPPKPTAETPKKAFSPSKGKR
jgi:hypothetical protein